MLRTFASVISTSVGDIGADWPGEARCGGKTWVKGVRGVLVRDHCQDHATILMECTTVCQTFSCTHFRTITSLSAVVFHCKIPLTFAVRQWTKVLLTFNCAHNWCASQCLSLSVAPLLANFVYSSCTGDLFRRRGSCNWGDAVANCGLQFPLLISTFVVEVRQLITTLAIYKRFAKMCWSLFVAWLIPSCTGSM